MRFKLCQQLLTPFFVLYVRLILLANGGGASSRGRQEDSGGAGGRGTH
jgi:hypothetical protein